MQTAAKDAQDQAAVIDCDRRLLLNEQLRENIKSQAAQRRISVFRAKRAELRSDCVLLFAGLLVVITMIVSKGQQGHAVIVAVLVLAGWALRAASTPRPRIEQDIK